MAVKANHIFPECYVDTNIMKTLLHLDSVNHQHSCSKVLKGMAAGRYANCFAIGIINGDKKKPSGYNDFVVLSQIGHLTLMKHNIRPHYLMVVSKAAEDFILSCVEEIGLCMEDFELPSTLEELKAVTKSCESDKDPRIKKLVNAIRDASEMSRLERTLKYLQCKQFDVSDDELLVEFGK